MQCKTFSSWNLRVCHGSCSEGGPCLDFTRMSLSPICGLFPITNFHVPKERWQRFLVFHLKWTSSWRGARGRARLRVLISDGHGDLVVYGAGWTQNAECWLLTVDFAMDFSDHFRVMEMEWNSIKFNENQWNSMELKGTNCFHWDTMQINRFKDPLYERTESNAAVNQ